MLTAKLACRTALSVFATLASGAAGAVNPAAFYSTTYQINPAHSGAMTFATTFAPPLKKAWSISFDGAVSYPIVADGFVYVSVSNSPAGTALLVAINLTTGKIAWQKATDVGYLAYDAGRLFFTDYNGPLQAFAAKVGIPLWSTQLPNELYFNFVPVAAGGSVFAGGDELGTIVYQVNEVTGAVGWSIELAGGGLGATVGGGQVYFSIPCDVPALAEKTGNTNWNYFSGCDGGGGAIAAYYAGKVYAPDVNLSSGVVLDATTGALAGSLSGSLPAFYGANSYTLTPSGIIAQNLTTGNLVWEFGTADTLTGLPIVVNGTVFAASAKGNIYALSATTGKLLQKIVQGVGGNTTSYSTLPGLAAGQGYLVAPTGNVLAAYAPE